MIITSLLPLLLHRYCHYYHYLHFDNQNRCGKFCEAIYLGSFFYPSLAYLIAAIIVMIFVVVLSSLFIFYYFPFPRPPPLYKHMSE